MARRPILSAKPADEDGDEGEPLEIHVETDPADLPEVEELDDTPLQDRDRAPMPQDVVDELEADELEDYSDKVKTRLKQYKKVWHDERRSREKIQRENQEAVTFAQKVLEENRRLKQMTAKGEISLLDSYKHAASRDLDAAKHDYRTAYEAGDAEQVVAAQEKLNNATYRLNQLNDYRPTLQEPEQGVETVPTQAPTIPEPDARARSWQERNEWYGTDPEMTGSAFGLHQRLITERGAEFAGTDDYWRTIDATMSRRFPEYFAGTSQPSGQVPSGSRQRSSSIVAPASRSRSPKKVTLTSSQLSLAKKFGLTPEQYAAEVVKLEKESR